MFIAVDLDGTLCDGSHKAHLLQHAAPGEAWPEQCWKAWLAACADDAPIGPTLGALQRLIRGMGFCTDRVEFWTGRGEHAREVTQAWLNRHHLGGFPLRMRDMSTPELGHEPDHVAKERFLALYGRPDLILEDRQSVVDMWRSHGIPCWQVAKGDY